MDQVIELTALVQHEVEDYASGETIGGVTYPLSDIGKQSYAVIIVPDQPRKTHAVVVVAARVANDKVIIDEDITDRPLWKELVRAGIPREQIILTYAGEKLPETIVG
jgi:XisI protein